jgi:hypothetical protein
MVCGEGEEEMEPIVGVFGGVLVDIDKDVFEDDGVKDIVKDCVEDSLNDGVKDPIVGGTLDVGDTTILRAVDDNVFFSHIANLIKETI